MEVEEGRKESLKEKESRKRSRSEGGKSSVRVGGKGKLG